jgi:hypothetical protein
MQSDILRAGTRSSPVVGVIVFVFFVAAISATGFWMLRGGQNNLKRSIAGPIVASDKRSPQQFFAPFTSAKPPSRPRNSAKPSSPQRQGTAASPSPQPEILSRSERDGPTEPTSTPREERVEPTNLKGNAPNASDSAEISPIEGRIYSANDVEVVPPRLEDMQSLSAAPVELDQNGPILFDIVVNELGTLDSVKTTVIPRTLGQHIWMTNSLSVVKTWRFRPALKDGQPVRYRLLFRLEEK